MKATCDPETHSQRASSQPCSYVKSGPSPDGTLVERLARRSDVAGARGVPERAARGKGGVALCLRLEAELLRPPVEPRVDPGEPIEAVALALLVQLLAERDHALAASLGVGHDGVGHADDRAGAIAQSAQRGVEREVALGLVAQHAHPAALEEVLEAGLQRVRARPADRLRADVEVVGVEVARQAPTEGLVPHRRQGAQRAATHVHVVALRAVEDGEEPVRDLLRPLGTLGEDQQGALLDLGRAVETPDDHLLHGLLGHGVLADALASGHGLVDDLREPQPHALVGGGLRGLQEPRHGLAVLGTVTRAFAATLMRPRSLRLSVPSRGGIASLRRSGIASWRPSSVAICTPWSRLRSPSRASQASRVSFTR